LSLYLQLRWPGVARNAQHLADTKDNDLPLFSAAIRREMPAAAKADPVAEALAAINPDELSP
jgi:hypothetical protein